MTKKKKRTKEKFNFFKEAYKDIKETYGDDVFLKPLKGIGTFFLYIIAMTVILSVLSSIFGLISSYKEYILPILFGIIALGIIIRTIGFIFEKPLVAIAILLLIIVIILIIQLI